MFSPPLKTHGRLVLIVMGSMSMFPHRFILTPETKKSNVNKLSKSKQKI